MRKPLRASTFCFFTQVVVSDEQGIEGWSNEVTADMAHALRGEVRESLIDADAIALKKTWREFPRWEHDSSSATESCQAREWLRADARRTGFGGDVGMGADRSGYR